MFKKKIKSEVLSAVSSIKQEIGDTVEDICMETIIKMFSDTEDKKNISVGCFTYNISTIGGKFKRRTIEAVSEDVTKKCLEAAEGIISSEKFIDSIIERIKRKQL